MTERQKSGLEVRNFSDSRRRGYQVVGIPNDDAEKIDDDRLDQLLQEIRTTPQYHVRRRRRKRDSKRQKRSS